MLICLVSIIATYILLKDIKFLFKHEINILIICNILFYFVQVLPYIIMNLFEYQDDFSKFPVIYTAITDQETNTLYCLFILLISITLSKIGKKYHHYVSFDLSNLKNNFSKVIKVILNLIALLPIFAVFFAPVPSIYLDYSPFYIHSYSPTSAERLFHSVLITPLNYIAVFSILALYYIKYSHSKSPNYLYILMFLISWIDGKRAIPIMFIFGIIAIDIIKRQKLSKILIKSTLFTVFILIFFVFHSNYTGKTIDEDAGFYVYEAYFSRMSCAMTALYDVTHDREMLDYWGQSVLFDIFYFVPRSLWPNKPIMFGKYYTYYATGIDSRNFNLLVNSWTEYIANFGFLGPLIVTYLFYLISKYSVKTHNSFIFILGLIFCVFYTVFGFEFITNIVLTLWVILNLKVKLNKQNSYKHKRTAEVCKHPITN